MRMFFINLVFAAMIKPIQDLFGKFEITQLRYSNDDVIPSETVNCSFFVGSKTLIQQINIVKKELTFKHTVNSSLNIYEFFDLHCNIDELTIYVSKKSAKYYKRTKFVETDLLKIKFKNMKVLFRIKGDQLFFVKNSAHLKFYQNNITIDDKRFDYCKMKNLLLYNENPVYLSNPLETKVDDIVEFRPGFAHLFFNVTRDEISCFNESSLKYLQDLCLNMYNFYIKTENTINRSFCDGNRSSKIFELRELGDFNKLTNEISNLLEKLSLLNLTLNDINYFKDKKHEKLFDLNSQLRRLQSEIDFKMKTRELCHVRFLEEE